MKPAVEETLLLQNWDILSFNQLLISMQKSLLSKRIEVRRCCKPHETSFNQAQIPDMSGMEVMLKRYKIIKKTSESELKTWVAMNLTTILWIVLKTTRVIKAYWKRIPLWIWQTTWMVNKIRSLLQYVFSCSILIRYKVHLWNYYKGNKVSKFLNLGQRKLC